MRAVVQRVSSAAVAVDGVEIARIGRGFLVLLGVEEGDGDGDLDWLCGKIHRLRVFPDDRGRMSLALGDIGGDALVVSQFTLLASTAHGNRPDFLRAAKPEEADRLYRAFADRLSSLLGRPVPTGRFAADMAVSLLNDGPVTIVLDSRRKE
ncbi:MAG: D-tyrosyl-tRNA(Tyr) deacylase [Planctomycetes bacterium]|nr:D-tyrosyl-tRNA(Tyr) deacylase [Planctomycetota bacterium]